MRQRANGSGCIATPATRGATVVTGTLALLCAASLWLATPAYAIPLVATGPFMGSGPVGATVNGAFALTNASTPPDSAFPVQFSALDFYPACLTNAGFAALDCLNGTPEADVYELTGPFVGQSIPPGNVTCEGIWTVTEASPGRWRFVPPGGEGTLMLAAGETCAVNFVAFVQSVPQDVDLLTTGAQTFNVTNASAVMLSTPPNNFAQDRLQSQHGQSGHAPACPRRRRRRS